MATNKALSRLIGLSAAGVATGIAYVASIRPWHMQWGATPAEVRRPLPGDELIANPKQVSTRAITITASAAQVWPWLVQLGQGRGGFYSYDWMENLAGCEIHTANRVIPELQQVAVGDRVRLGPEGYPFYTVAGIEPERAFLLRAAAPEGQEPPIDETWLFYLDEIAPNWTRLIVRNRRNFTRSVGNLLMWRGLVEPLHFIMEQRMLQGIKARAEQPG